MNDVNLKKIIDSGSCIGCGLCFDGPPSKSSDRGFIVPHKVHKDKYSSYCPSHSITIHNNLTFKNRVWGDYLSVKTAYSSNSKIRYNGASGGVITSILKFVIEKKIANKVLCVGIDKHKISTKIIKTSDKNKILHTSGSKYLPSSPLENIREIINDQFSYVVVAKPCDIAVIRQMINDDLIPKNKFKLLISFFCAGVSSIESTKNILKKNKINIKNVISYRYRGKGWPGFFEIISNQNLKFKLSYEESWGKYLGKNTHKRCKYCPDGIGLNADIVVADPWNMKNKSPVFSESPGLSLIITRTKLGELFLQNISTSVIKVADPLYDISKLKFIQKHQYLRRRYYIFRLMIFKLFSMSFLNVKGENFFNYFLHNPYLIVKEVIGSFLRLTKHDNKNR
jgi:coenzyme F420-reducing hydrogenase beta subunit